MSIFDTCCKAGACMHCTESLHRILFSFYMASFCQHLGIVDFWSASFSSFCGQEEGHRRTFAAFAAAAAAAAPRRRDDVGVGWLVIVGTDGRSMVTVLAMVC